MLCITSGSFFGRPLFFNSDFLPSFLREGQWAMFLPRSFKYILYNNWFLRKKYFVKLKRYDKHNLRSSKFINKVSFLVSFGLKFVYQKFSMLFGNSFMYKSNWWEKTFIFSTLNLDLFYWWFRQGLKLRKRTTSSSFYPSTSQSKFFFFWDPLEDDYKSKNLKYHIRRSLRFGNGFFYNDNYYKNLNFQDVSRSGFSDFYCYKESHSVMADPSTNLALININYYV